MKKLIIVNGTMGVGKTTTCRELMKLLTPSVFLDGDWCWYMNPFVVNEENKHMVMDNIVHLLRAFLSNSSYEYVIFCWVLHQENITDEILHSLADCSFTSHKITLVCSPKALKERLMGDVAAGVREEEVIDRSLARIKLYQEMDTHRVDVSCISPSEAAKVISTIVH